MEGDPIKVLLVEDNEEHAELMNQLLLGSDNPAFEVHRAAALRDALDALDLSGFRVILLGRAPSSGCRSAPRICRSWY